MRESYRLPSQIAFPECLSGDLRLRLHSLIHVALRRASEGYGEGDRAAPDAPGRAQPVSELVARERLDRDGGTYAVPSYGSAGALTPLPVRQRSAPAPRWRHPAGKVAGDSVIEGDSPFAGQEVATFPEGEGVRVQGGRYAVSSDLCRALTWGRLLFGSRPYAVVEGAVEGGEPRYFSVGTSDLPRRTDPIPRAPMTGGDVLAVQERIVWQPHFSSDPQSPCLLRALVVGEGEVMWPPIRGLVEEFYDEIEAGDRQEQLVPKELARTMLFAEIDRLIDAGEKEEAVQRLLLMDAAAFALVDWEAKEKYLELLLDCCVGVGGEGAIVEILRSLAGRVELEAALKLFSDRGRPSPAGEAPAGTDASSSGRS